MTQIIEFDGKQHQFPDDFTQAEIGQALASMPAPKSTVADIATQFSTHAGSFLEQAPGIGPSLMAAAGRGVDYLGQKFAPGIFDPNKEAQRQEFMATNKPTMLINPPPAETPAGQAAGTAGDLLALALGRGKTIPQRAAAVAVPTATGEIGEAVGGPYGKLVGILGGAATTAKMQAGQAERAARQTVPEKEPIKGAATATYQDLRAGNVAQPVAEGEFAALKSDIKKAADRSGPDPLVAQQAHGIIDRIGMRNPNTVTQTEIELAGPGFQIGKDTKTSFGDVADLVTARQRLKDFFSNPLPDPNKAVAAIAIPKINQAIERLSPDTMARLREADRNYSAAMTSERLDKRIARAEMRAAGEHSGMGLGNKLKQNAASMLLSAKESRGLTAADETALKAMNKGAVSQNAMRFGSNLLGGGGGLGSTLLGLGVGGTGYATGHPEAAALPFIGLGLRRLYNRSVANQAANISAQIRARSPHAQSLGALLPTRSQGLLSQLEQNALAVALAQRGLLPYDQSIIPQSR